MALRERITVAIDFVTDGATRGLGNIKSAVADADGAVGKFKAGSQAAMAGFGQYAAQGALAAGTALVAFGAQAVGAFQETALGAGRLRDSLGLTADEASRLQEVGGDLGISTSELEGSIGRMNRTAANSPAAFDAIGAAIVRNKDGSVDTMETYKNVAEALRRIPDPARRAAAAQEILGRSWQSTSELVMMGADGITAALADVEDAKVIDDEEIKKARRFRDSMDRLKGIYEEVTLIAGEALVPALAEVADTLANIKEAVEKIPEPPDWVKGALDWAGPIAQAKKLAEGYEFLGKKVGLLDDETKKTDETVAAAGGTFLDLTTIQEGATTAAEAMAIAEGVLEAAQEGAEQAAADHRAELERQRQAVDDLYDANVRLVGGELAVESAQLSAKEAVEDFTTVAGEAEVGSDEYSQAQLRAKDALLGAAQAAADYRIKQAEANGQTLDAQGKASIMRDELVKLASTMDPASPLYQAILGYIAQLDAIPREIDTRLNLHVTGMTATVGGELVGRQSSPRIAGHKAHGGPVSEGHAYIVGENGEELFVPGENGMIVPSSELAAMRSAGRRSGPTPSNGGSTPVYDAPAGYGNGGGMTVVINGGLIDQQTIRRIGEAYERWKRGQL